MLRGGPGECESRRGRARLSIQVVMAQLCSLARVVVSHRPEKWQPHFLVHTLYCHLLWIALVSNNRFAA